MGLFLSYSTEKGMQERLLGPYPVFSARESVDLPATALYAALRVCLLQEQEVRSPGLKSGRLVVREGG